MEVKFRRQADFFQLPQNISKFNFFITIWVFGIENVFQWVQTIFICLFVLKIVWFWYIIVWLILFYFYHKMVASKQSIRGIYFDNLNNENVTVKVQGSKFILLPVKIISFWYILLSLFYYLRYFPRNTISFKDQRRSYTSTQEYGCIIWFIFKYIDTMFKYVNLLMGISLFIWKYDVFVCLLCVCYIVIFVLGGLLMYFQ